MSTPDPENESSDPPMGASADTAATRRQLPLSEAGAEARTETLSVPGAYAPRKRTEVLELDMGDGVILYDDDTSLVHHLNPSAALIWHVCDGSGTVGEIARDIAEEYGLDVGGLQDQVAGVVAEFDALGLVEDAREAQTSS